MKDTLKYLVHNLITTMILVFLHMQHLLFTCREILPTIRHYPRRNRSTRIINGPTSRAFDLRFNTMSELTLRLVSPHHQQSDKHNYE